MQHEVVKNTSLERLQFIMAVACITLVWQGVVKVGQGETFELHLVDVVKDAKFEANYSQYN